MEEKGVSEEKAHEARRSALAEKPVCRGAKSGRKFKLAPREQSPQF
jgi:hypothetical protein